MGRVGRNKEEEEEGRGKKTKEGREAGRKGGCIKRPVYTQKIPKPMDALSKI